MFEFEDSQQSVADKVPHQKETSCVANDSNHLRSVLEGHIVEMSKRCGGCFNPNVGNDGPNRCKLGDRCTVPEVLQREIVGVHAG